MKKAKLIQKVEITNLPTNQPAYYYGGPDGNVYVIYQMHYETPSGISKLEFVIAKVKKLSYDYDEGKWIDLVSNKKFVGFFNDVIDKPNQELSILKTSRIAHTYGVAEALLNKLIEKEMGNNLE